MSEEEKNDATPEESDVTPEENNAAPNEQEATPENGEAASEEKTEASDEPMTDEEKEMLAALDEDADAPSANPTPVHPVEMDPVKTVPKQSADNDANLKLILDIPVEVKVEVGGSRLTINEVLNLAPGSIIELDRTAGSPADLIVNGAKVGHGDVVVIDDSYGIRLTKLIDPQDRIDSL